MGATYLAVAFHLVVPISDLALFVMNLNSKPKVSTHFHNHYRYLIISRPAVKLGREILICTLSVSQSVSLCTLNHNAKI